MSRYQSAVLAIIPLTIALAGCAVEPAAETAGDVEEPAAMAQDDVAAIDEVREMEAQDVSSGDADTAVRAYSDDVVMMPPDMPRADGKDAAREVMAGMYEQNDVEVSYTSADTTVQGDWAFEHYAGVATFTPKDGGDPFVEEVKGIHIYRRGADGTWQITHDIWNTDAPPPG